MLTIAARGVKSGPSRRRAALRAEGIKNPFAPLRATACSASLLSGAKGLLLQPPAGDQNFREFSLMPGPMVLEITAERI